MERREKLLLGTLLMCTAAQLNADCAVTPYFSARSQGVDAARQMVGWEELINQCNKEDCFYCVVAGVAQYSSTFRSKSICECLFGTVGEAVTQEDTTTSSCDNDCNNDCNDCSIRILGSCVDDGEDRPENAWLADYFGLPTDYASTITFSPRVKNFIGDIEFYAGLNDWRNGLYFRLNLPIVHTKWALRACEEIDDEGNAASYPAGYFSGQVVPRSQLVKTALDFFSGCNMPDLATGQTPAVKFQPLKFSKWSCDSLAKTRLADVTAILGYNFVCSDCGFFGLNIRASAPTGNKPKGEFLFEPIAGNGQHWTLGVGLNAHYNLWRSKCDNSTFGFYLDANINHLFSNRQTRTFDLCEQGDNSRYMLAQKLEGTSTLFGNTDGGDAATNQSNLQFANEFAPVANLIASKVNVRISVEGEVAFKFAYVSDCGFAWDLGYNFWGKSCERISPTKCCKTDLSLWALKGDAFVYGFNGTTPVPLGATESGATINAGTAENSCGNAANTNIDNPQFAVQLPDTIIFSTPNGDTQTRTSIQPVTLDTASINYASNRGRSNKIFTNLSYSWTPCEDYTPFIGIGGAAEFGQRCGKGSCDNDCDDRCESTCAPKNGCDTDSSGCDTDVSGSCVTCALSQWSFWIKGGISFN